MSPGYHIAHLASKPASRSRHLGLGGRHLALFAASPRVSQAGLSGENNVDDEWRPDATTGCPADAGSADRRAYAICEGFLVREPERTARSDAKLTATVDQDQYWR